MGQPQTGSIVKYNTVRLPSAFATVTTLFFALGFITSNNDPLIAVLKASFHLSYTEALMTQLVSFAAYGFMSFPAAMLVNRIGSLNAILLALATMMAGCLLVQFVTRFELYGVILAALFILAVGITMLQVAANPLAAALGRPETSHFRLTLAQAFNSLGVVLGVNFGSRVMLGGLPIKISSSGAIQSAQRAHALGAVTDAFRTIAVIIALLMGFIWLSRARLSSAAPGAGQVSGGSVFSALRSRWAIAGALAIGLYVGAEVSIGSIMINFLNQPGILKLPLEIAGFYVANVYWMGALAGRFIGSYLLTRIAAPTLLMFAGSVAAVLCLTVVVTRGPLAGYAALSVGLFNSIMFPTIFTITLERARVAQATTSGLLCLAIVGGAIIPYSVGVFADAASLSLAFAVPMSAYAYITVFALRAKKPRRPLPLRLSGSKASSAAKCKDWNR